MESRITLLDILKNNERYCNNILSRQPILSLKYIESLKLIKDKKENPFNLLPNLIDVKSENDIKNYDKDANNFLNQDGKLLSNPVEYIKSSNQNTSIQIDIEKNKAEYRKYWFQAEEKYSKNQENNTKYQYILTKFIKPYIFFSYEFFKKVSKLKFQFYLIVFIFIFGLVLLIIYYNNFVNFIKFSISIKDYLNFIF